MKFIDISTDALTAEVYPGDVEPSLNIINNMAYGDNCNLTAITMSSHCGTHMDAPLHFISDGKSIDEVDPNRFIGQCVVISANGLITGQWVEDNITPKIERLIIKGNKDTFLMESAAYALAQTNVKLIGINQLTIGCDGSELEVHRALLSQNIAIIENLNLSKVNNGEYFLIAPPIKCVGIEASPVRAILVEDYIFWSK